MIRRIFERIPAPTKIKETLLIVVFYEAFDFIQRGKEEQILLKYVFVNGTVTEIAKMMVISPDDDMNFFGIVAVI